MPGREGGAGEEELQVAAREGALLDYTLYVWHVLTHRVAWLWRFHEPHHADLDASTALRFHFAELALAAGWRAAQVLAIGVVPRALAVWQTGLVASILFHHANVRLPERLERALGWVVVTPRLHGIHHSTARDEVDSNWSSGLTLWARLHGTLRRDVPQDAITIGVPEVAEVARRCGAYRGDRPPLEVRGRIVILVDDGLATGVTTRAAIQALRARGPRAIVLAVPVCAAQTAADLRREVDEVVCAIAPTDLQAVGCWYHDFSQASDAEVVDLLARARRAVETPRETREDRVRGGAPVERRAR